VSADEEIVIGGSKETPESPSPSKAVARPRGYDPALAEKVLLLIADGKTLREIADSDPSLPTKSTIQRWIMKYPDLAMAWKAAREMSAATLEDEALDMARTLKGKESVEFTGTRVRAFEVAMAQFRWSASHRDPAQYGQTTVAPITVPIQIITNLDLGQGGVITETQQSTYEIAAKVADEYNAKNAEIEGTDYTLEQGEGREAPQEPELAPVEPASVKLSGKRPGRPPGKGKWKTPAQIKSAITKRAKKGLKE